MLGKQVVDPLLQIVSSVSDLDVERGAYADGATCRVVAGKDECFDSNGR